MSQSKKPKWMKLSVLGVLLVAGLGWVWSHFRTDPQVAVARAMQRQLMGAEGEQLPETERRELWTKLREQVAEMTPEQRREVFEGARGGFEERIDKFFTLTESQRQAFLDEDIDRMEKFRAQAGKDSKNDRGPRGGGRNASADKRNEMRRSRLDRTTPEQRAKFSEYRRQLQARRQQRGLAPVGPFGR